LEYKVGNVYWNIVSNSPWKLEEIEEIVGHGRWESRLYYFRTCGKRGRPRNWYWDEPRLNEIMIEPVEIIMLFHGYKNLCKKLFNK